MPLRDAELLQRVRELRHLGQKLGVGELAAVAVRLAFPVVRDRVAASFLDVLVEAVPRDVQPAAEVPLARTAGSHSYSFVNGSNQPTRSRPFALPERVELLLVDPGLRVRLRANSGDGG